ncbi:MAG TPA: DUF87 domain-containing protein [Candidatus Cloacimonas sp.]|nr:DUF87 domain-containing protein [Candidatus Cloacimonas sp.]HPS61381.1 DUF87 domain-containing protein [Candidatus Cloacimonas sp.]
MKYFKLTNFTLAAEKFQKFKGYNGRTDFEYKMNNGIVEIKELLDYICNKYGIIDVYLTIAYRNQKLNYYIGLSIEDDILETINIGRTIWQSTAIPDNNFEQKEVLYGANHISTSDDLSINLIDDIVRAHSKYPFKLEYSFTLSKYDINYKELLKELEKYIKVLSKKKAIDVSKPNIIGGTSKTIEHISEEVIYNYLSELYYLYRASSSICKYPKLSIYSNSIEITDSIISIIIKRSQSKNVYCFNYWFFENYYTSQQKKIKFEEDHSKPSIIEDAAGNLFKNNFLVTQFVPTSFIASVAALPNTKIPGITYIDEYEFGSINDMESPSPDALSLGCLYKNFQTELPITVYYDDLVMHSLVTGVTGSGKTTTIKSMLLGLYNKKIPFLILEPAKTEYKDLNVDGLKRYLLGIEAEDCLKLNPL